MKEDEAMHEEDFWSSWLREDERGEEERTAKAQRNEEEKVEKRKREEEKASTKRRRSKEVVMVVFLLRPLKF